MKHAVRKSPAPSQPTFGWAATLLLALSACSQATNPSVDAVVEDTAPPLDADASAPGDASDGRSTSPDARKTDAAPSQADAADATSIRADAVVADAVAAGDDLAPDTSQDAAPEAASTRADAVAPDRDRSRSDATVQADTSPRADAVSADTQVEDPDVEALPCQLSGPATLVHLTPLELKTILDGSDDPYLINVKGTSIANIPGTDAVLANDIPGIEALVGGNLCADIILYCRSGNASQTVGNQLIAKGYLRVRDLEGGIIAWTAAGYPTE
jgi:rhodanese-related sulfurtransferase